MKSRGCKALCQFLFVSLMQHLVILYRLYSTDESTHCLVDYKFMRYVGYAKIGEVTMVCYCFYCFLERFGHFLLSY